ncbi:MAG: methicillin resistance protein [Parcubacteria group bacterium Gr01-1014_18]|nr:MAG: methicillin resistance protein [Parcubacteria group bacterium Greene0416_36]TSC81020.1 MAG: methicillin resistance protein [Parcubacteria group bacterium Gr01-1014_18]TSC98942.1 MAG: methicillin resistance protein [Parcubacteria group bacterium Greene1014_20]TSD06766.1 MAG: methicillin resistance protein [Parcubacteria group bacterium Greene0714_2]
MFTFSFFQKSEQAQFDDFIERNALDGGLLQGWLWGDFKGRFGAKVLRVGVSDESGRIVMAATLLKQKFARFWSILYSPRGPVFALDYLNDDAGKKTILDFFLSEIATWSREEKILFTRLEPSWTSIYFPRDYLAAFGFLRSPRAIQPTHSLVLDIRQPLDSLLYGAKQKTRYNINLANKKGIIVRHTSSVLDLEVFLRLMKKTSARHNFKNHDEPYFREMFGIFAPWGKIYFVIASHQGVDIAANCMLVFGNTAYYLYGASDYEYRQLMAPYLVHWTCMTLAKEWGLYYYDWWGISGNEPSGDGAGDLREKDWEGFSRLKRSFAPIAPITEYVGCWELPYRPTWYKILRLLR